jgi:hypothetical protein
LVRPASGPRRSASCSSSSPAVTSRRPWGRMNKRRAPPHCGRGRETQRGAEHTHAAAGRHRRLRLLGLSVYTAVAVAALGGRSADPP